MKIRSEEFSALGAYDIESITHAHAYAFTLNGQPTITSKEKDARVTVQRDQLSEGDTKRLKKMYNCPSAGGSCVA